MLFMKIVMVYLYTESNKVAKIRNRYNQALKHQSQQRSSAFVVCRNVLEASSINSVDLDQTDPGPHCWSPQLR